MYNEEFADREKIQDGTRKVVEFIDKCDFGRESRVWKHADMFTLLVEIYRVMVTEKKALDHRRVGENLGNFYNKVGADAGGGDEDLRTYERAALQATNDRSSRLRRGEIVARLLRE